MAQVEVNINAAGLSRALDSAEINRMLRNIARRVETRAKQKCPVRSGNLRNSIRVSQETTPAGRVFTISANAVNDRGVAYAKFVTQGTKSQGRNYIYPKTAPVLYFRSRGRTWALKRVHGQKKQPFLEEALREVIGRVGL